MKKTIVAVLGVAFAFSAVAASAATTYTRDLTIGSTGADVASLQTALESKGSLAMPATVSKGYFGALTKSALAKYQASVGITPATGYFGPITRAHFNNMTTGGDVDNGDDDNDSSDLSGGEGDIKDFKVLGNPGDEDIDEGESVKIYGFEFDAEDSDLRVERLDVFAATTSKPWKVVDSARLLLGSEEVAEVTGLDEKDAWDDEGSDEYSFRFSDIDTVVEEGETAKFYVEITAQDSIDSDEEGDIDFSVPTDGLRVVDAEGIDMYEGDGTERTVTFGEAASGDLEIKIDGADNEDRTVFVDENSATEGVEIMRFTIEGDESDVTIDELSVVLATTTATSTELSDVITSLTLEVDGDELSSESVADGSGPRTVTFEDLEDDFSVADGDEVEVVVYADFDEQEGNYGEGYSFEASVDASDVDAEDEYGDTASVSGDVTGGDIEIRVDGIVVEFDSASAVEDSADDTGEKDTGTYSIRFDVTANGDDVYVDGAYYTYSSTTLASGEADFDAIGGSYDEESNTWKVSDGDTATFELTVELTSSTTTSTSQRVNITGITWDTTNAASTTQVYNQDLTDFKTKALFLGGK